MNGYLIIAGAMLVCFADREAGRIEFKGGTEIAFRYPFLGIVIMVAGVIIL
jgi:hypothetical protein